MANKTVVEAIRILLVDDHALFRESVATALAAHPDFAIDHCASVTQALRILQSMPADVVLLDYDLGNERGWQFFHAAEGIGFQGRVLIVTAWVGENEARRLMRLGASGIFSKESALVALANAIRTVARGELWLDEAYLRIRPRESGAPESSGASGTLTQNERKVLRYVLEGLSNKDIAWRLSFSESYVKAILQQLFQHTGVRTRGQLVRLALERYNSQL